MYCTGTFNIYISHRYVLYMYVYIFIHRKSTGSTGMYFIVMYCNCMYFVGIYITGMYYKVIYISAMLCTVMYCTLMSFIHIF